MFVVTVVTDYGSDGEFHYPEATNVWEALEAFIAQFHDEWWFKRVTDLTSTKSD